MPRILLARRGLSLVPVTPHARKEIEKIAEGGDILVTIARARSGRQNSLYWSFIAKVAEGCGYDSAQTLHNQVKAALGYADLMQTLDGKVITVLRSTSFDDMEPEQFNEFFNKAIDLLCRDLLPHLSSDELKREIAEMISL